MLYELYTIMNNPAKDNGVVNNYCKKFVRCPHEFLWRPCKLESPESMVRRIIGRVALS
jgi:hypothetical protein